MYAILIIIILVIIWLYYKKEDFYTGFYTQTTRTPDPAIVIVFYKLLPYLYDSQSNIAKIEVIEIQDTGKYNIYTDQVYEGRLTKEKYINLCNKIKLLPKHEKNSMGYINYRGDIRYFDYEWLKGLDFYYIR